jgi:hypothetical protein
MKSFEVKELLISSLNPDIDLKEVAGNLEDEGISYDFSIGFGDKILDKLFSAARIVNREIDFVQSMNIAFYRIAISGVAAIVILLISIFLKEGFLSVDSFLGLRNSYDESIICLLTGN